MSEHRLEKVGTPSQTRRMITRSMHSHTDSVKPVVLEEDDYTESISRIIQRDFFPELPKIRAQHAYLKSLDGNATNINTLNIGRTGEYSATSVRGTKTPRTNLTDFQTPTSTVIHGELENYRRVEEGSSGTFLHSITNAMSLDEFHTHFTSEDNASFRELLDASNARKRRIADKTYKSSMKSLTSSSNSATRLITSSSDALPSDNLNALMAPPQGIPPSIKRKMDVAAGTIQYQSLGRLRRYETTQSPAPSEQPLDFVETTPLLKPGVDASPLMTWGQVESTPLRIEESDGKPAFKVPPTPQRENVAHRLASRAAASLRSRQGTKTKKSATPSPRGSNQRPLLSPAAQKLLSKASPRHRPFQSGSSSSSSLSSTSKGLITPQTSLTMMSRWSPFNR